MRKHKEISKNVELLILISEQVIRPKINMHVSNFWGRNVLLLSDISAV